MQSVNNFRNIPANEPKLFMGNLPSNLSHGQLFSIVKSMKFGYIQDIKMTNFTTTKGKNLSRAIVTFRNWFDNPQANSARCDLLSDLDIKLIHNDPHYIKVVKFNYINTKSKSKPEIVAKKPEQPKPKPEVNIFNNIEKDYNTFDRNSKSDAETILKIQNSQNTLSDNDLDKPEEQFPIELDYSKVTIRKPKKSLKIKKK